MSYPNYTCQVFENLAGVCLQLIKSFAELMFQNCAKYQFTKILTTLLTLVLMLSTSKIAGARQTSVPAESSVMAAFYTTVASSLRDSSSVRISKLHTFLKRHPEFERVYLKLLQEYTIHGQVEEAKKFFSGLASEENYERNSQWMLAKIYAREKQPEPALKAFTLALRAAQPSPKLLTDFLLFDNQYFGKFKDPEYLQEIKLSEENRRVANALHTLLKLNFEGAIRQFNELPQTVSHNLTILYYWGYCCRRLEKFAQVDSLWHLGLQIAREKKDLEAEARFLMVLGLMFRTSLENQRALSYFDSSNAIARRIGDLHRIEYLAGSRSVIYRDQGEYHKAEKALVEAIHISKKLQSDWKLTTWYSYYGWILLEMKRFDEALQYFDLSAEYAKTANHKQMQVRSLVDKGDLYVTLGQDNLASIAYNEALKLAQEKNLVEFIRQARMGLADIFVKQGKYEKARKIYQEYIQSPVYAKGYQSDLSYWFLRKGRTYLAEQEFDMARHDFQKAYELAEKTQFEQYMTVALLHLADLDIRSGDLASAWQRYNTCLQLAGAKQDSSTLPSIYSGLGNLEQKSGNLNKAIRYYREAAGIIEITRGHLKNQQLRIGYFVEESDVYDKLIECYYDLYTQEQEASYLDTLYTYMEMTRGRALRDLLRQREVNLAQNPDSATVANYRRACENLQRKQRSLRDHADGLTEEELDNLLSDIEIARSSVIAQRLRLNNAGLTGEGWQMPYGSLAPLAHDLKSRQLGLLFYHVSEEVAFVLAVAGDELKVVSLPGTASTIEKSINALVAPFHQMGETTVNQTPFKAEIAYQLYRQLFKPVQDSLHLPQKLLIVPDIALVNLPLEMLLSEKPEKSQFTPEDEPSYAPHFLQHRYAFSYAPSTTLLQSAPGWSFAKRKVLIFANPFEDLPLLAQKVSATSHTDSYQIRMRSVHYRTGLTFESLPNAEVEANKIKTIHAAAEVYMRSKATEKKLRAQVADHDILHISTHGIIDSTYDLFSGLVLAATPDDSTDDGLLMGYEISELNFDYDLITLSACETGRGRPFAGEGVLGLPRLFLSAGTKSVIMTHWKVDDSFSSILMPKFYDYLLNKGLSKTEALTQAKRDILNKHNNSSTMHYEHPAFWAPFTLFGDPGNAPMNLVKLKFIILIVVSIFITTILALAIYTQKRKHEIKLHQV